MSEAQELLDRIAWMARAEEAVDDDPSEIIARLEQLATPDLLPAMLAVLVDEDPHGVLWSVFYIMESMDDAYLEALLDDLPALWTRAPRWAETALVRILNTRGEPEDCTATFERLAQDRPADLRRLLAKILRGLADQADELTPETLESVTAAIRSLGHG